MQLNYFNTNSFENKSTNNENAIECLNFISM